ncbi:helix-turn-helix domain-containing protein [Kineosporia sp. R_H_3]|uniref:helix-turn-helix domain-containing protein n=1 Tax=Kineosporia sp. R_H_3 TaxID=1961848 RepID=UPI000B4B7230|nr:helix-turn-helix domain-containing protein [Kineosporia sp. R_H_3]
MSAEPLSTSPPQYPRPAREPAAPRAFYNVREAARMFGMSAMTLYRAIEAGEFPAVRIRGRLIIPARAIDEMVAAALRDGQVDAADFVPRKDGAL